MMQGDVSAAYVGATGSAYASRTRVKGISICPTPSQAATLLLKDGGSTGTVKLELGLPSAASPSTIYMLLPQQGILFTTDVYVVLEGVASVTVFYG